MFEFRADSSDKWGGGGAGVISTGETILGGSGGEATNVDDYDDDDVGDDARASDVRISI